MATDRRRYGPMLIIGGSVLNGDYTVTRNTNINPQWPEEMLRRIVQDQLETMQSRSLPTGHPLVETALNQSGEECDPGYLVNHYLETLIPRHITTSGSTTPSMQVSSLGASSISSGVSFMSAVQYQSRKRITKGIMPLTTLTQVFIEGIPGTSGLLMPVDLDERLITVRDKIRRGRVVPEFDFGLFYHGKRLNEFATLRDLGVKTLSTMSCDSVMVISPIQISASNIILTQPTRWSIDAAHSWAMLGYTFCYEVLRLAYGIMETVRSRTWRGIDRRDCGEDQSLVGKQASGVPKVVVAVSSRKAARQHCFKIPASHHPPQMDVSQSIWADSYSDIYACNLSTPLIMGLFSCCISDRKQSKAADAEARHTRIVEIYHQAETETGAKTFTQLPPPSYHEVVYDDLSGTIVLIDDKPEAQPQSYTQPQRDHSHNERSMFRPASPQTSIYSVPSTRLTDITSAPTGGTAGPGHSRHDNESPRSSLIFDSAPPSYYDGRSIRERSRSPDGNSQRQFDERTGPQQHPVMDDQWLDVLQQAAESQERRFRGVQSTRRS